MCPTERLSVIARMMGVSGVFIIDPLEAARDVSGGSGAVP